MAYQPVVYHGDEIEVDCNEIAWSTKKLLRVIKCHGLFQWRGLLFIMELRVDSPNVPSFAGIFIDEAEEPEIEVQASATEYELFEMSMDIKSWATGTHLVEMKLRSDGDKIYNQLFEVYTIPPLSMGSFVKTS